MQMGGEQLWAQAGKCGWNFEVVLVHGRVASSSCNSLGKGKGGGEKEEGGSSHCLG